MIDDFSFFSSRSLLSSSLCCFLHLIPCTSLAARSPLLWRLGIRERLSWMCWLHFPGVLKRWFPFSSVTGWTHGGGLRGPTYILYADRSTPPRIWGASPSRTPLVLYRIDTTSSTNINTRPRRRKPSAPAGPHAVFRSGPRFCRPLPAVNNLAAFCVFVRLYTMFAVRILLF